MKFNAIPVIRIFDEEKARDFYLNFLGMNVDWEHRFEDGFPLYMQVSRNSLVLHLTEHSGDCTPGAKVFVETPGLDAFYADIMSKDYKHSRPEIFEAAWGDRVFEVTDPFANRLIFNEQKQK